MVLQCLIPVVCSETIHLSTSHEGRAACIGERIVFMCSVTEPGILQWAINGNPIRVSFGGEGAICPP